MESLLIIVSGNVLREAIAQSLIGPSSLDFVLSI